MTTPPILTVYTGQGCCLCDDARAALAPLERELGFAVQWVYIDGDEALEQAHREEIPVGYMDGRKVFKYHVDEVVLRRRIAARAALT